MKKNLLLKTFLVLVVLMGLLFVLFVKLKPDKNIRTSFIKTPPGCIQHDELVIGGCFGKNTITDFKIDGNLPDCLKILAHTCNGANILFENFCKDMHINVNGIAIPEGYPYYSFSPDSYGNIIQDDAYPPPEADQKIILNGDVNGTSFSISYTETKALCD